MLDPKADDHIGQSSCGWRACGDLDTAGYVNPAVNFVVGEMGTTAAPGPQCLGVIHALYGGCRTKNLLCHDGQAVHFLVLEIACHVDAKKNGNEAKNDGK